MPKKYRPETDDYMIFTSIISMYGMFRPIEDKLRAAGYTGPIFADFDNRIYSNQNINKNTELNFLDLKIEADENGVDTPDWNIEAGFEYKKILTKDAERKFQDYTKKFESYLDLIIKNTPPEEYPEELSEIKYFKAAIRMIKVFGARALWQDQLGFLANARSYDSDMQSIDEIGKNKKPDATRELWREVKKHYPYSQLRDSIINITNLVCDYEENKEKNTYIEQIEYRENYKKALQNYLSANEALEMGPEEKERISKLYCRKVVIDELKNTDGPGKDIDYNAIIKRVEEKEKAGEPTDPDEQKIVDDIREKTNNMYKSNPYKYEHCNSRYSLELEAMGYYVNERDFTGKRGNETFKPEIEAQINAIDMGWPVDELIHIQRLSVILRDTFSVRDRDSKDYIDFAKKCKTFYEEKIKDKPYPSTEKGRRALYREFYSLGKEASEVISSRFQYNEKGDVANIKWDVFKNDIKKTMNKPLSFSQKIVLKQIQVDEKPELSSEGILAIKNKIDTKRRIGHTNSAEFDKLQKAFNKLTIAFNNDTSAFVLYKNLDPKTLNLLEEVKAAAKVYLKEKDKEAKTPEERSTMGKDRYEGALQAYQLVTDLINQNQKNLEDKAKARKEAEDVKARKELREAFFKTGTDNAKRSDDFDVKRAGGEDKFNELKAEEARRDAEQEAKEPVTDAEKYEKLINSCRLKKSDPAVYENAQENETVQNKRIDNLSLMLAAMEMQEKGQPFNMQNVTNRSKVLRNLYSMDSLKIVTENVNGPENLKNGLTFKFRATELKKNLEEALYEVGKVNNNKLFESQNNYQQDLKTVLGKEENALSPGDQKIVAAINEITSIDLNDRSYAGLNAYKLRKANVKLMETIVDAIDPEKMNQVDRDGFKTKFALDALAVLTTYTGCQSVTNKFLQELNTKMADKNKNNIDIENFTKNYGVNNSENASARVKHSVNNNVIKNPVNHI
ncbi:hypothetical protein SAMN06297422_11030 [Lachnospiraceae bacterium]|nr:hypothetical protein SAMN06297422_11030 [Lachnospiraceae bacterium]